MKAILEFKLDDPNERLQHLQCVKAGDLSRFAWDVIMNSHRELEKLGVSEEDRNKIFEYFESLENKHNINVIDFEEG